MTMYQVYDRHTGQLMGKAVKTLAAASRKVDKLDLNYGACRYGWRRVQVA